MKNYLKNMALMLICTISLPYAAVNAKSSDELIKVSYNDIKLYADDEKIVLTDANNNAVEPFIYEGTTYLPLRAVAETLLMNVGWDSQNYIVSLKRGAEESKKEAPSYTPFKGEKEINISYRNISVELDGEELELKSADGKVIEPFIYEGTTYLPLRAVAEATSTEVNWDGSTNSIHLIKPEEEIRTESVYDISAGSDWTKEEAQAYGYTLDFESKADDDYVKLVIYDGEEKDVLVPAKIDGKTVYIEGGGTNDSILFGKNENIEYVTFENGVAAGNINNLFLFCSNLKGVYNLPNGVGGSGCFASCKKLAYADGNFSRLANVTSIFSNCNTIKEVPELGSNVTSISVAFVNCKNLLGDIYLNSSKIATAADAFKGTEKEITVHVPYPSTSYDTLMATELPENITIEKSENKIAYLPKEINIAAFTSMDLYNYSVAPSYSDCEFQWECDIGTESKGKYTINATEDMVGAYPISVTISKDGEKLYTANSVVNIVSVQKMSKTMTLVCIGDAYTMKQEWKTRVGRYSERIKFVGTRASSNEGRGGADTAYYLSQFNYTADKNGVGTDNPFFNPETKKFDWAYYKRYSNLSPSAVQLYFQNNTAKSAVENVQNMRVMFDAIRAVDPDEKIFIVLPAYLASWGEAAVLRNYDFVCALEEEFAEEENVYFIPLNLTYNQEVNYNTKTKYLPNDEGYNQWGDCMFGAYAAALL